jgi:putative RNA 2'-phosphotransferase
MKHKNTTKISKFLSLILRHDPDKIGLKLNAQGWANVKELLKKSSNLDMKMLEFIVENNNKKRFEFNDDKTKIRARQGHSIKVDLGYKESVPPEILYHGTARKNNSAIRRGGLKKMNRHAVHLSVDRETADNVGRRHGKVLVFVVHAKEMHDAGEKFYLSNTF